MTFPNNGNLQTAFANTALQHMYLYGKIISIINQKCHQRRQNYMPTRFSFRRLNVVQSYKKVLLLPTQLTLGYYNISSFKCIFFLSLHVDKSTKNFCNEVLSKLKKERKNCQSFISFLSLQQQIAAADHHSILKMNSVKVFAQLFLIQKS